MICVIGRTSRVPRANDESEATVDDDGGPGWNISASTTANIIVIITSGGWMISSSQTHTHKSEKT